MAAARALNSGGGSRAGSGSTSSNGGGMTNSSYSSENSRVFVQASSKEKGKFAVPMDMRVLTLPKLKGQPSSNNVFGVNEDNGKYRYHVGVYNENGKIVMSNISETEFKSMVTKLGYNPIVAKKYLFDNSTGNIPKSTYGKRQNILKDPALTKPVQFKISGSKTDDDLIFDPYSQAK